MADALSPKQEAFAAGLAEGLNQSAAYRRAYPASLKWADKTVWARASELAADSKVAGRVTEIMAKAAKANEITAERIMRELALIAFGNKREIMAWGPGGVKLRDSNELTDDQAAQVSEVKETITATGGSLSLKTHDKVKALELLGKVVGMFPDKVEITGKGGGPLHAEVSVPADPIAAAAAYAQIMQAP